jgi:2-amino-4-hydroxy-6-hydroxymethyldihydropteridine diphosphokinase
MHKAFLSLGSNIGDKVDYLDKAVEILKNNKDIHNLKVSSYYATDPVGYTEQDMFVNIAVVLETTLAPEALLDVCQNIETDLDRVRVIRWGPRTIDVDIILYDTLEMDEERLTIPHPRMYERGFVLIPIQELSPELVINQKPIQAYIDQLPPSGVRKI